LVNFDHFNSYLLSQLRSFVQKWAPGGRYEGNEYKALNPTRADSDIGSFSINVVTGQWADYADPDPDAVGKTPLQLYHYLNKRYYPVFKDAVENLAKEMNFTHETKIPETKKKYTRADIFQQVHPIPENAPSPPSFYKRTEDGIDIEYPIEHYFQYVNRANKTVGYVVRFKTKRKKEALPLCYCYNRFSKNYQWVFMQFADPHPIFNLYRIANNHETPIIIVEGEKCAQALQDFFHKHNTNILVTCWIGGCKAKLDKIDWKPLSKRKIVLWPDNDVQRYHSRHENAGMVIPKNEQPGYVVMKKIEAILLKLECNVEFVDPPFAEKPDGWDCYDAIYADKFTVEQLQEFIQSRTLSTNNPSKPTTSETPADQPPPFRYLGYSQDTYYYLPAGTRQVKGIRGGGHSAGELICLAGKKFWYHLAAGPKGNIDWLSCADTLLRIGEQKGIYDPSKRRGRGAWTDKNRIVLHLGNRLIVDNKEMRVDMIDSDFIYEEGSPIDTKNQKPLSDDEAYKYLQIAHMFHFENALDPFLLAGYSVLVPICGALEYRPNIWITGASQTGKSFVMQIFLHPAVEPFSLFVSSGATAASIRYKLVTDAFGVLYDESEGETDKTQALLNQIFEMARASSSQTGAKILKATQNQKVNEYETRSMFCFASIGVSATQAADVSRLAVITLKQPPEGTVSDREATAKFIKDSLSPEYCAALRARTFKLIPVIKENAKILKTVISEQYGLSRLGDLYGTLLAGAISLKIDTVITHDEAVDFLKGFSLEPYKESFQASDETALLDVILQHTISVDSSANKLSIAEMVTKLKKYDLVAEYSEEQKKIRDILNRYGIKVDTGNSYIDPVLWISDSHNAIKAILVNTPWPRTWGKILGRMKNAVKKKSVRFTGSVTGATGIPFKEFYSE
jgi:putative DNA primase/helicase